MIKTMSIENMRTYQQRVNNLWIKGVDNVIYCGYQVGEQKINN
ncbi:TPA: hypothetical protein RTX70_001697 [Staphylococcus aureus]|nr:hypothetical protein [Staphylococcus aureus]HDZ6573680.1 hypothetical protein [Staphylococcus aureus]